MIPVDPAVTAAITSPDRQLRPKLSIDWWADGHGAAGTLDDLSPHIDGWRRSQSWSTDVPEQVRVVQGSATASLSASVVRGDILGRASTVTYLGVGSTANDAGPDTLFGLVTAPSGAVTGSLLIIAVAVYDLTVQVTAVTDMTSLGAVTVGAGATGMRLWLFQHRLRPTVDPYDTISVDVDGAFVFSTGDSTPYSMGAVAFNADVRDVDVKILTAETVAGTSHTTGAVTVPDETVLVTVGAWNTGTSGTWTPPSGDTERLDVRGTHASTNIALTMATSAAVDAGTYTKTVTTSASTAAVATALIAVSPHPATDERNHAARWLSPTNRDSRLHPPRRVRRSVHADVEIITSGGPATIRRFTGFLRDVSVSAARRTAEITALDGRELMRTDIDIPPILGDYGGLNASWLVSYACYASGVYVSPPATVTTARLSLVWMPMHGSLRAMFSGGLVGFLGVTGYETAYAINAQGVKSRAEFVTGPYLLAAKAYHASDSTDYLAVVSQPYKYFISNVLGTAGTRKGRVEFQVRGDAIGATSLKEIVYLQFVDGADANLLTYVGVYRDHTLTLRVEDGGADLAQVFGPAVPTDGEWHECGISWDFDAGTKVVVWWLDGAETTSNPAFTAAFAGEERQLTFRSYLPVAEVHLSQCATTEPWIYETVFTPEAYVDRSLLELAGAAYRGKIECWKLCADLASAEQAVSAFDELGVYRYQTRRRLVTGAGQTVQVTLADNTAVTDLDLDTSVDRVRNVIEVPWTAPLANPDSGVPVWLWTFSGVAVYLPPEDTATTIHLPFNGIPWAVDTFVDVATVAGTEPNSYIFCNANPDGTGTDIVANITPVIGSWTTEGCDLTIFNDTGQKVWLVDGAIGGYAFGDSAEGIERVQDDVSVKRYNRQPLKVGSSPWVQRSDVAEALGGLIVADTANPTPVITSLRIVGDPRLQTGDRVRIVDRYGAALDGEYWLVSIQDGWDGPRFVQTCTARAASTVMVWGETPWGEGVWG